jgi:hypothetical protein
MDNYLYYGEMLYNSQHYPGPSRLLAVKAISWSDSCAIGSWYVEKPSIGCCPDRSKIERRHDVPNFIKQFQTELLYTLFDCNDSAEVANKGYELFCWLPRP